MRGATAFFLKVRLSVFLWEVSENLVYRFLPSALQSNFSFALHRTWHMAPKRPGAHWTTAPISTVGCPLPLKALDTIGSDPKSFPWNFWPSETEGSSFGNKSMRRSSIRNFLWDNIYLSSSWIFNRSVRPWEVMGTMRRGSGRLAGSLRELHAPSRSVLEKAKLTRARVQSSRLACDKQNCNSGSQVSRRSHGIPFRVRADVWL